MTVIEIIKAVTRCTTDQAEATGAEDRNRTD